MQSLAVFACVIAGSMATHLGSHGGYGTYGGYGGYPAVKEVAEIREEITEPAYGHNTYGYGNTYGHNNAYGYGHNMLPMQVAKVQQITSFPSKTYY